LYLEEHDAKSKLTTNTENKNLDFITIVFKNEYIEVTIHLPRYH
jgi:hypothetical protein